MQVFASAAFEAANSEYLSLGSAICTSYPLSVSAWFKVNDVDNRYTVFSIHDSAPSTTQEILTELHLNGLAAGNDYSQRVRSTALGTYDDNQSGSFTAGAWLHFGVTHAGIADRDIYPNGGAGQNDATSVNPTGVDETSVGVSLDASPTQYIDGKIAEVAVWCGTELSAATMANLAAGDSPMTITPEPTAYWRLLTDATDYQGGTALTPTGTITYSAVDHPNVDDPPSSGGGGFLNWLLLSK